MKKYISEYIGTFALVFAGTGAVIINDISGGAITHLGVGLVFGLIIMTMIYALGEISGAHFNPAVSFGFWLAKRLPLKELLFFITSQILGGITASIFLKTMFPLHKTLGVTLPNLGGMVALEAIFAGPITGASMNPARSLAPALVSGHFEFLWIYLTAPFLGSALAILTNNLH